jgi:hypothetical protein
VTFEGDPESNNPVVSGGEYILEPALANQKNALVVANENAAQHKNHLPFSFNYFFELVRLAHDSATGFLNSEHNRCCTQFQRRRKAAKVKIA